jgi:hypothetical protein
MRELQPNGQWPVWSPPRDPATGDEDGYGGIASYVTPTALENFPAVFRPGLRDLLRRRSGHDGAGLDRLLVEELWRSLVDWEIPYDAPPWNPAEGQRVRDPEWLLRRHGAGTCVDFGLLFAAACLREELDTSLVMLRGARRAHVAVAVRLGARPGSGIVPLGVSVTGTPGVTIVDDVPGLLEDQQLLLVDVTVAAAGQALERDLSRARQAAARALSSDDYPFRHLVDVAARWAAGDRELPAPLRRGALRGRIAPATQATTYHFPGHKAARDALRDRSGKVVISGPQGVGKSTLAREVALLADSGFGWFLPAASRVAFETALAGHELAERGLPVRALEAADRQGLAQAALTRLRDSADAWVIVLDNANEGAKPFDDRKSAVDRLPEPRDGQLIIATSNAGQDLWPGWGEPVYLAPVPYHELAAESGDEQAAALSVGRPLLMTAFSRLLTVDPAARGELPAGGPAADGADGADDTRADQAAALYWTTARKRLTARAVACAERLAWMPPDHIDPGAGGDDPQIRGALAGIGLLGESADAGARSLHRLFGKAIRQAVSSGNTAERTVCDLLARPEARAVLLRHADPEVTAALAGALDESTSGLALWALGAIQEVHQSGKSAATFGHAEAHLDLRDPEQASAYADCLHARGRIVNQDGSATAAQISAAIADMRRAIDLRPAGDDIGVAKHQALMALLRQRAARKLKNPEKIAELREVMQILDESWQRRLASLGPEDPLVDRAYFNRAGVRISLAKVDRANAAAYLAEAERVYRTTLSFRRRYYHGANPITAASVAGIGIWGYEAVRLGSAGGQAEVLAEAIAATVEALDMRRKTSNDGDVAKSANMLAKLGTLQSALVRGKPQQAIAEAASELEFAAELRDELERPGEQ